jgi:membrane complex biogenesis BtpA family protein
MNVFGSRWTLPDKAVIGMIHAPALPGTPYAAHLPREIATRCAEEAALLESAGFDAVIVENMHDRPYLSQCVGPEIVATMTAAGLAVRGATRLPLGIQVLAGANREAMAVALACGAEFVRVEGFVFAHVADEGLMATASAGELLRYRRSIGADAIAVIADVKKKHASHAITADVDLAETGRAAEFFGADAVVVTGTSTGRAASVSNVREVVSAVGVPVLIGSGLTPQNIEEFWPFASAFIVGSYIKRDGLWSHPLDLERMEKMVAAVRALRSR